MLTYRKSDSKIVKLIESIPHPRFRNKAARIVRALRTDAYIWDPWILQDDDVYRLFYLMAPKPNAADEFWSQSSIYGAVSQDLRNWKTTGIVLAPSSENEWESGRILAGNTYKKDGIYYLFYSASGGGESLKNERIALATSTDGLNWQRTSNEHLFSEDEWSQWYGKKLDTGHFHWRDPYIIQDGASGQYCMFITAHLKHNTSSCYQGCIALATATELAGPYTLQPPVAGSKISGIEDWPFTEMERPQVIYRNDKYYLFFSCWLANLNPEWSKKVRQYSLRDSSLYWLVADQIGGPYRPGSDFPIVPGSNQTGLYGTNFSIDSKEQDKYDAFGWNHNIFTLEVFGRFDVSFDCDSIQIARTKQF